MPASFLSKVKGFAKGVVVFACVWMIGLLTAGATSLHNKAEDKVTVKLAKGERIGDAVSRILASAKEHDETAIDPAKKGFATVRIEIRDPDLTLSKELNLADVRFGDAINLLCEATGGAFLIQEPDHPSDEAKFLFFRNSETATRDVFYDFPEALSGHLVERLKAGGFVPGPGECIESGVFRYRPIRGDNRCQAAVKKLVAEAVH